MRIPEEKVLQWLVEKVEYNQLPPEQRKLLDDRKQAQQRAHELEKHSRTSEERTMQMLSQAKGQALDALLERSSVQAFANAYDQKFGQEGAFRDAVCDLGSLIWEKHGVDLSPEEAIKGVMDHYGKFVSVEQQQPQAVGAPDVNGGTQTPPSRTKEPPVIPNVSGRQTSATKPKVRSLDDIKKLAASYT